MDIYDYVYMFVCYSAYGLSLIKLKIPMPGRVHSTATRAATRDN